LVLQQLGQGEAASVASSVVSLLAAPATVTSRPVRRSVQVPCQVVRERDFRLLARWMVDLSPEGMRVRADLPVLTGEVVIVSFLMPIARAWIDAEAYVARVIHGRRPHDRGRELGIHFEHLDRVARSRLGGELDWFRPAGAHRR
jgi:hypothetical protein